VAARTNPPASAAQRTADLFIGPPDPSCHKYPPPEIAYSKIAACANADGLMADGQGRAKRFRRARPLSMGSSLASAGRPRVRSISRATFPSKSRSSSPLDVADSAFLAVHEDREVGQIREATREVFTQRLLVHKLGSPHAKCRRKTFRQPPDSGTRIRRLATGRPPESDLASFACLRLGRPGPTKRLAYSE
jgi:hypothetical protein